MKHLQTLLLLVSVLVLGANRGHTQEETPIIPVGWLTAFPEIVQAGTHPELTWDITIPERAEEIADLSGSATLTPVRDLIMDVLVVGNGVTAVDESDPEGTVSVPVDMQVNYSGQGPVSVFFDNAKGVKPNKVVYSGPVSEGSTIDFGGRYYHNDTWGPFYDSSTGTPNIVALRNGDIPPTSTPLHENPDLESFLVPYLDENGRVKLGSRDVLILMELTHTDEESSGFDLQDAVLLVTFYDERNNNGHGNNVDGVDSSNPGNAPFTDSDPTVDDEEKVRGHRKK